MRMDEVVEKLYGKKAGNIKIKLGLKRIETLCEYLGNPQNNFKTIHVAGTNGKGSVTKALSDIFIKEGYKVGTFISPHLVHINERIRINGINIPDEDFVRVYSEVLPYIERMESLGEDMSPSFFEIITAMAFKYFSDENVSIGVIEVGLGGRLDSTNVIQSDVDVISTIQYDHMKILGDTLEDIAFEKAGIIKEGASVILGDIPESPKDIIIRKAHTARAKEIFEFGKEFEFENPRFSINWNMIDYKGIFGDYKDLIFKSNGAYQPHNISLAVAAAEIFLKRYNKSLDENKLRETLKKFRWEGRFEITEQSGKKLILEGAHNPDGVKMLRKTLDLYMPTAKKAALIGILDDKDFTDMVKDLSLMFDDIIITSIPNNRSVNPEKVFEELLKVKPTNVTFIKDTKEAYKKLLTKNADYYFVTGSLYLVGEIRSYFGDNR